MTRLVIFDIDGTLVDSLDGIVATMARSFAAHGLDAPPAAATRRVVGRSLELAVAELLGPSAAAHAVPVAESYRAIFAAEAESVPERWFPDALATLRRLHARPDILLGIATGKSRRGIDRLLGNSGLSRLFATVQTADDAASKPDPQMIVRALAETGVAARAAVMVGDSVLDMAMARAAGARAVGVGWGSHPAGELMDAGADIVVDRFEEVAAAVDAVTRAPGARADA